MATNKPGVVDLKGQELEGLEKGKEVCMSLGVQLFLLLELSLQSRKIIPKTLI